MPGLNTLPPWRRFLIALLACIVAVLLFHGQVALALVTRGDDALARGDASLARVYYERALRFDPDLETAADRYVFFALQMRSPRALSDSTAAATLFLASHPGSGVIHADRALCYQILKRYDLAASDFAIAAVRLQSPVYYTFAGWARYRLGDSKAARRLWRSALAIRHSYGPALGALRKLAR